MEEQKNYITGFDYIADSNSIILILGSIPGERSLMEGEYYAHPRNLFWPIMGKIISFDQTIGYSEKRDFLLKNRIAIWDVLHSCYRLKSLDSNIDNRSLKYNDILKLLEKYKNIKHIFFNGQKAFNLFKKQFPTMIESEINLYIMPSTSPANASIIFEKKLKKWMLIKKILEEYRNG